MSGAERGQESGRRSKARCQKESWGQDPGAGLGPGTRQGSRSTQKGPLQHQARDPPSRTAASRCFPYALNSMPGPIRKHRGHCHSGPLWAGHPVGHKPIGLTGCSSPISQRWQYELRSCQGATNLASRPVDPPTCWFSTGGS